MGKQNPVANSSSFPDGFRMLSKGSNVHVHSVLHRIHFHLLKLQSSAPRWDAFYSSPKRNWRGRCFSRSVTCFSVIIAMSKPWEQSSLWAKLWSVTISGLHHSLSASNRPPAFEILRMNCGANSVQMWSNMCEWRNSNGIACEADISTNGRPSPLPTLTRSWLWEPYLHHNTWQAKQLFLKISIFQYSQNQSPQIRQTKKQPRFSSSSHCKIIPVPVDLLFSLVDVEYSIHLYTIRICQDLL